MTLFLKAVRALWTAVVAVLRFANLIEPSTDVILSITKVSQWASLGLLIYMCREHPDDPGGVVASLVAVITASAAAGYRRHSQYKSGKGPYEALQGSGRVDSPD